MSKRKTTTLATILLCSLLIAGVSGRGVGTVAWASGTPTIEWDVFGGGGGRATAGIYTLEGTIGQATAGTAADTDLELCSGFWCWVIRGHRIYLPLILKND